MYINIYKIDIYIMISANRHTHNYYYLMIVQLYRT